MWFNRENLAEASATLKRNKLRTGLTGFAVAWGILFLILLLGTGQGLINGIKANVESQGLADRTMKVYILSTSLPYDGYPAGTYHPLNASDIKFIEEEFEEVDQAIPNNSQWLTTTTPLESYTNEVKGANADYFRVFQKVRLVAGRRLNEYDEQQHRKVAVISEETAERSFELNPQECLGKSIQVGESSFEVVGVYAKLTGDRTPMYIPMTTYNALYASESTSFFQVDLSVPGVKTMADVEAFRKKFTRVVGPRKKVSPNDPSAYYISSSVEQAESMDKMSSIFQLFFWCSGMSALIIGVVGVANIMLVSVRERMREIGIRKAIGAQPKNIIGMVMTESVLVTLVTGLIGMVIAVLLLIWLNHMVAEYHWGDIQIMGQEQHLFKDPMITPGTAFAALLIMVMAGLIAGYIPTKRAIKVSAIEAMREK